MTKRRLLTMLTVIATAFVFVAAGCGGSDDNSPGQGTTTGGTTTSETGTTDPAETETAETTE